MNQAQLYFSLPVNINLHYFIQKIIRLFINVTNVIYKLILYVDKTRLTIASKTPKLLATSVSTSKLLSSVVGDKPFKAADSFWSRTHKLEVSSDLSSYRC